MTYEDNSEDEVLLAQIASLLRDRFAGRSALIVEDEIVEDIKSALLDAGFARVCDARTVADAISLLVNEEFDILVLDRGLPDGDGIAILKLLRSGQSGFLNAPDTPCLVYSMFDRTQDKVAGLLDGASDYLAKSDSEAELLARLANQLPKNTDAEALEDTFSIAPLHIDEAAMVVSLNGQVLPFTTLESVVFIEIWRAGGQPVPKTALWERCWMGHAGWSHYSPRWENCMEKAISRLRRKIRTCCTFIPESHLPLIVTWRSTGFAMRNLTGLHDALNRAPA